MFGLTTRYVGCLSIALGTAACGGDFGLDDAAPDGTGDTGEETAGTGGLSGGAGADDAGESSGGETTGGDPNDGGEGAECTEIDCGPNGECVLGDNGTPMCSCDQGHASIGYRCVPCEPSMGTVDLDLPLVVVTGRVLINGDTPPSSEYEDGNLFLRNLATGDEVYLGSTHDAELQATVVPGTYDVVYEHETGGDLVPSNRGVRLEMVEVDNMDELLIDIPVSTVSGDITLGGAAPPQVPYENGQVVLRNLATGDEVLLAETSEGEYLTNIVPGTYAVHYRALASDTIAPANPDAFIETIEVPAPSEIVHTFDIDIPVVHVDGDLTVAGAAPPAVPYENGRITFVDSTTGSEIDVAETREGAYDAVLVPGTYDIFYSRIAGTDIVPANKHARLETFVDLTQSKTHAIDVGAATLSGAMTVAGQPAPSDNSDDGVLSLRDQATGDIAVLGNTHDGSFSRIVVPGTYEVYYGQETAGSTVPTNLNAKVADLVVGPGATASDIDIPAIDVQGTITVNGGTPPTSEYSDGRLYLRNLDTEDSVLLGNTRMGQFSAKIVPGPYEVVYVVETAGDGVPVNAAAILDTVVLDTPQAFDVDVPVVPLSGLITLEGSAPPATTEDHGLLFLEDVDTSDVIFLGDTRNGSYATRVASGRYLIWYRLGASSGQVPSNLDAGLRCIDLTGG